MKTVWVCFIGLFCLIAYAGADHYAAQNGQTPGGPYTSWETAASNIQDAVNVAATNAVIWIGAGRYTLPTNAVANVRGTNVVYIYKPLTLRSSNSVPADTIIDGGGSNRCMDVYAPFAATNRLIVDGLTLCNGYAYGTNGGGAIAFSYNNVGWTAVVQNCVFKDNTVLSSDGDMYAGGGAIYVFNVQSYFGFIASNCVFQNNRATNTVNATSSYAGGLALRNAGQKKLTRCVIESNSAAYAGGIHAQHSTLEIENCIIRGNRSEYKRHSSYGGGGLYLDSSSLTVRNSLLYNNWAAKSGGAIGAYGQGSNYVVELYNSTVVSNAAEIGGAIYVRPWGAEQSYNATVRLYNSIVYSNAGGNVSVTPPPAMTNIVVNSYLYPTNGFNDLVSLTGLITNPLPAFVDVAGQNYRLTRTSPCVNNGTNQAWMAGAHDLDDHSRIDRFSGMVDMGCYEHQPCGVMHMVR